MIRKNGTSPWRFVAAALVPLVGASTALAGSFKLNVGTYKVSIAYDGSTADVRKLLGTIPTYTDVNSGATKWAPATAASDTTLKSAALAMGLGHTLFLLLSDIEADLKATTLADATLDKTVIAANVVEAMGINQWFSTALQETRLVYAEHSGYFQNDNAPDVIYSNASNSPTVRKASKYKFLQNLTGGSRCDLTTAAGKGAVLNYMNLQGFVWAAVEKGYFEALSYNINKTGYGDVPSKGFSFPQWAMNYASKAANATHYPLPASELSDLKLDASLGFTQAMGLIYNRGQYPFVNPTIYPGLVLNPILGSDGSVTFQSTIAFQAPKSQNDPPEVWGKAYTWQFPWLIAAQRATGTLYTDKVSAADVLATLALLKGMFNGNDTTKADAVVDAATAQVNKLSWDQPYSSDTTSDNMRKVAQAILDASN